MRYVPNYGLASQFASPYNQTHIDTMKKILLLIATLVPSLLAAPSRAADAQAHWTKQCASCHGKDGKGQTKAGKMAGVKDMTTPQYHAELKDDKAFKSIKGGIKEGEKVRMKPAEGLSDDQIKALVAHVRAFKK